MELIRLQPGDLAVAALLVLILALLSWRLHLGVGRRIIVAAVRSVVQLMLLGLVQIGRASCRERV